ncbi:MAG: hypothetical protein CVT67_00090 [Actinobacteria bacterium HGW-Actinobacteria-7]|nr:MAG: hypothetical protein CVT67_00090 [Actinobacteria bacterium HGW-Actinobacteria-7]
MAVQTLDQLNLETRLILEKFLDSVSLNMRSSNADVTQETVAALTGDLLGELDADSTPSDAHRVLDRLGAARSFGSAVDQLSTRAAGTFLGVPYDVRLPTAERLAGRLWDPRNPRVFVPRVFGAGWDINFGAIAVSLRLIEPDSEDEPFAAVPVDVFLKALSVPLAMTAAIGLSYGVLRGELPDQLPSHWNFAGHPDDMWSTTAMFLATFGLAALPTVWAAWSTLKQRSALARGATIGLASFAASLACGVWLLSLITVGGGPQAWWIPLAVILPSFVVTLVVFAALARIGRSAELKRDLEDAPDGRDHR